MEITSHYYRDFTVSGGTDKGKFRYANEDGLIIDSLPIDKGQTEENDSSEAEPILLLVVDGSGSHEAGKLACTIIHDSLLEELKADGRVRNSIELLSKAIERSNAKIHSQLLADPPRYYGATMSAVLIESGVASIAQVGDTRAYLMRGEHLVQVTLDQTLIEVRSRLGYQDTDQEKSAYSNVILQSLGAFSAIKLPFSQIHLKQLDRLLVCSDGLWRAVSDNEIREILRNNFRTDETCEELIECALKKGSTDNISVIVAEASGEALPERSESESPAEMFTILSRLEEMPGLEEIGLYGING